MHLGRSVLRFSAVTRTAHGRAIGLSRTNFPACPSPTVTFGPGSVRAVSLDHDGLVAKTTVASRKESFDVGDGERNKKTFMEMLERFKIGNPHRKGHVEFILTALDHLEEFGVHKDLEAYKALMDLFPKEKLIAQTMIQAAFSHFPRHQDTALLILETMLLNKVFADREMRKIILEAFGSESHVFKKYGRIMYWIPKMKNISPWPVPRPTPRDPRQLAHVAIERIMNVDPGADVVDLHSDDVPDSIDKTWIISGQSQKQRILLAEESGERPVRVEGPHRIWLRDALISYFILVGDPREKPKISINTDDISKIKLTYFGEKPEPEHDLSRLPNVHEQSDATIYAVCSTGTSSRDSLLSWIRLLEKTNPCLQKLPVVFKLLAPCSALTNVGTKPANESVYELEMASQFAFSGQTESEKRDEPKKTTDIQVDDIRPWWRFWGDEKP